MMKFLPLVPANPERFLNKHALPSDPNHTSFDAFSYVGTWIVLLTPFKAPGRPLNIAIDAIWLIFTG